MHHLLAHESGFFSAPLPDRPPGPSALFFIIAQPFPRRYQHELLDDRPPLCTRVEKEAKKCTAFVFPWTSHAFPDSGIPPAAPYAHSSQQTPIPFSESGSVFFVGAPPLHSLQMHAFTANAPPCRMILPDTSERTSEKVPRPFSGLKRKRSHPSIRPYKKTFFPQCMTHPAKTFLFFAR